MLDAVLRIITYRQVQGSLASVFRTFGFETDATADAGKIEGKEAGIEVATMQLLEQS